MDNVSTIRLDALHGHVEKRRYFTFVILAVFFFFFVAVLRSGVRSKTDGDDIVRVIRYRFARTPARPTAGDSCRPRVQPVASFVGVSVDEEEEVKEEEEKKTVFIFSFYFFFFCFPTFVPPLTRRRRWWCRVCVCAVASHYRSSIIVLSKIIIHVYKCIRIRIPRVFVQREKEILFVRRVRVRV